jgi:sialate O-acetylesterase
MKNKFSIVFLLIFTMSFSNVSLPNFFSDNMVLQRNATVKLWGWANPNEEIIIKPSWNNEEYKTKASNQASWSIEIPTLKEGGPYTISIKGYNEIIFKNILLGEVWLCSGQSNMEMSAAWGIKNGEEEIQKANHSTIRFFSVPKLTANSPQINLPGKWEECSSESMRNFSAVAYFFATRLQEELKNVPIGLIHSSWGGSPAEVWIEEDVIKNDKNLNDAAQKIKDNEWSPTQPAQTFNAMIHPFIGFKMAGVLWYQGESNVGSTVYDQTLSALIASWRKAWKFDFPFYYVQIAPYDDGHQHFASVEIRNAQRKVLQQTKNTGMVVISDVGDIKDIHPKDKKSVGVRLANLALSATYKTNSNLVNGPLFNEIKIDKNKIYITFDFAEGLYFKYKNNQQFEVAGADGIFHTAKAVLKNNQVIVYSKNVKEPVKVRFAWQNQAESELFNQANLPASSFVSE